MPFKIKSRVVALNKYLVDLIPELEKRGISVCSPSILSESISGKRKGPKADRIVSVSNEIVTEWENERR